MSEVSCRACVLILEGLRDRRIPEAALVSELPVTLEQLRDVQNRIPWNLFVEILERTEELCGGSEALEQLGAAHITSPSFAFLRRIAPLFVSSRENYWMGARWFGHYMFWSVDGHFEELPDGRLRETVQVRPGYRDSPAFFRLLLGAIRSAPRHLGQPDSIVKMDLSSRRAVYEIEPPPSPAIWARLRRRLVSIAGPRGAVEELRAEEEELRASYAKLGDAMEELRGREQELRAILSSLDGIPTLLLNRDGRVLSSFGTAEMASRYGFPSGELEGRHLGELMPPESAALGLSLVRDVFEKGRSRQIAHTFRSPIGEFRFESCLSPIRSESGEIRSVLAVNRDVSEREKLQENLQRADRLASIGTLAAGIAHELNNPLGSILLSAEHALSLEGRPEASPARKECLNSIISDAERCNHIVKGVLRFTRSESSEKVPCDLNTVVLATHDLTGQYVQERHSTLALDLAQDVPPVRANPLEIEQVIVNLIRNSIEAAREKADVVIRTELAGGNARIAVSDSGPGLSNYELQHIFDPFYTTRRSEGGTGLGLSVVHGIVTDHGGSICATRTSGGGTEIVIELPGSDAAHSTSSGS